MSNKDDQDRFLEDSLKQVKAQSFRMKNSIEKNDLRQCLKEASLMLMELKTALLSPKNYYHLYTFIFDEMQYLTNFFREEARRGRRVKELYEAVQQSISIIPRIFLLVSVGTVFIEAKQGLPNEILFDLLQMIKGIQNPLRGLFTRYYLLKMTKDLLPDEGNEFINDTNTFEETVAFLIDNFYEMNRLWIRLSLNLTGEEKTKRDKERSDLKVLVGENLTRLAALNGLKKENYQEEVLPKLLSIILESKDESSQQYLLECIIHAFPDEYNIHCINSLLEASTKLLPGVDVKTIFIALMEKLAKYVTENSQDSVMESTYKLFAVLQENIGKIMIEGSEANNTDILKLMELQVAFLKFAIKCAPIDCVVDTVNQILISSASLLNKKKGQKKMSSDGVKLVSRLLTFALESPLSILNMTTFPELMSYLDYQTKVSLSMKIIKSLANEASPQKLDSHKKVSIILDFINPLLEDSPLEIQKEDYQFDSEQTAIARFILLIQSNNPNDQADILLTLKNIFVKGGERRTKYTLPPLVNSFLLLCYSISEAYLQQNKMQEETNAKQAIIGIHQEFSSKCDMSSFNSDLATIFKFITKIYNIINDILTVLVVDHPELAFKLHLSSAIQINNSKYDRSQYEEYCYSFLISAVEILQEGKIESEKRLSLFKELIGTISTLSIFKEENIQTVILNTQKISQSLLKKYDQCVTTIACCHLFNNSTIKDKVKIVECLTKSKKLAEFSMTTIYNSILFVDILNAYLYFIDIIESEIKKENITDLIEVIKNYIETIKVEEKGNSKGEEIEMYFNNTIASFKVKQNKHTIKLFEDIIF